MGMDLSTLASVLRLNPQILAALGGGEGGGQGQGDLSPELLAALGGGNTGPSAPSAPAAAAQPSIDPAVLAAMSPGNATGPTPPPAPPQAAAAMTQGAPTTLGQGPQGDTTPDLFSPVHSKSAWWKNFIGNMAAGGGADPGKVADFKDPTYRDRVIQQRQAQAKMLFPNDPVGQTLWVQGDADQRKAMGDNYKDLDLKEGDTLVRNGKPMVRAPRTAVGADGGRLYTVDDQGHAQWLAARPPSPAEQAEMVKAEAEAKKATAEGVSADAKATEVGDKGVVNELLKKAMAGEKLSPAEQQIFDAHLEGMKKGGGFNFNQTPPATTTPPAPGDAGAKKPPAGAIGDGFPSPKTVPNRDGYQYYGVSGGKKHLYQVQGGKSYDLGVHQ